MGKQTKSTKKFLRTQLDSTIKRRRDHQKKRKVVERNNAAKKQKQLRNTGKKGKAALDAEAPEDLRDYEDDDVAEKMEAGAAGAGGKFKGMSVDDFLGGGFKSAGADDEDDDEDDEDEEEEEEADDLEEVEEMSEDEEDVGMHAEDLERLKEKDPEFYAYLQENDKALLEFGQESDEDEDQDDGEEEETAPSKAKASSSKAAQVESGPQRVTLKMLAGWQKSMLSHRSLKALRRLLIAFRCAVKPEEEDQRPEGASFIIEEARVFNKLVLTALKYTPVVLQHHVPITEDKRGYVKIPSNNKKWNLIKKPIQSYFSNLFQLTETLTEPRMLEIVVRESTRMVPYALCIPKTTREFIKVALNLWSSQVSEDGVRMSAFLTLRRLGMSGGTASLDNVLRGVYSSYIQSSRSVSIHTQPMLNLMKNTAVELYLVDADVAYTQAFGFIRQLAIHLRNCVKTKTKDAFKAVLNWQFVSAIDFWSLLLARACDLESERQAGVESPLKPLVYPLVQVATGVVGMVPNSRYFPYRLHLLKSMMRIISRTGTYIPLAPLVLSVFESPEFQRKLKGSTSAPIDFSTTLRAPTQLVRTRPYSNQLLSEYSFLLLEFLASQSRSIAFPELVLPLQIQLKRLSKSTTNAKFQAEAKQLLDKSHQTALWVGKQRDAIDFTPKDLDKVKDWEMDAKENPLEAMLRLAKKVRAKQEALIKAQAQVVRDEDESDDDDEEEEEDDEEDDEMEVDEEDDE
ncbi:related to excision repair protein RAD4 [Ustilago trichophora]|uniref:Related to excision repair protein RAD4 n=1 Tax=Ustilago trichophora TaxID=86804 RepID=A0A5C3E750_9BASI|nr:related to excision repair protein RAD4 [Ustilago trichophora]